MEKLVGMDTLGENQTGQVKKILLTGKMRNRLNDLGLIEGTYTECLYRNKGISAYMIRGAVIAIRTEDTSQIKIIISES
ncbi:MAG: ferrous iron transport protein A [Ruminococcus sp.]|nr:ferrous iron transport protein A [Ruminococcus sp.]